MTEWNPLVSIVIPVYNGDNYLREAIDSVLSQTYKNIEILVINDGSNDNGATERIALSYGDKIRYFYKENGGVATALNLGIEQMRGEYFSWLSQDDLYLPEKIQAQLDLISSLENKKALVTCVLILADERGHEIDRYRPFYTYSEEQLSRPLFALFHGLVDGRCLLIHKSQFKRVGAFNETMPTTEDYDLWFRMMRNEKLYFIREPLVKARCQVGRDSRRLAQEHESDQLWIQMIDRLTNEEKSALSGSLYGFYSDIYRLLSNMPYTEATDYAQAQIDRAKLQMLNALIEDHLPISHDDLDQLDYSSKDAQILLRETSILLYKLCNHYEALLADRGRQLADRERQLADREQQLEGRGRQIISMPKRPMVFVQRGWLKKAVVAFVRMAFRAIVRILNTLHIKEPLKKTGLYRKMKSSSLLLKLSSR